MKGKGATIIEALRMATGAGTGKVLTSDASGNATWQAPGAGIPAFRGFSAFRGSAQAIAAGSPVPVIFDNVEAGTNGDAWYSTATGRFTPQVAGKYYIGGSIPLTTAATVRIGVFKNGVEAKRLRLQQTSAANDGFFGGAVVVMNGTTDFVTLNVTSSVANNVLVDGAATLFQGHLIGT